MGASVFERQKCTYLWSRQQSPENRFSSLFLINLWTKTRDSDILQRRPRKIYNPSGWSLSSISHEDLTVFSCEAGNGVLFFYCSSDRRRLGFCVELWECGSRSCSVDTENKSRSWQVEGPAQCRDCIGLPTVADVLIGWSWMTAVVAVTVTSPLKKQIKGFNTTCLLWSK